MTKEIHLEAFDEGAVSDADALGASARFVASRSEKGLAFRLEQESDLRQGLVSKDEVLALIARWLEDGSVVHVA